MCTRMRSVGALALGLIATVATAGPVASQTTSNEPLTREEFERRLNDLTRKYEHDLAARDAAIAELRQELQRQAPQHEQQFEQERAKAYREHLDRMLEDIETGQRTDLTPRAGLSFNPDIAVISDFLGTWSNNRRNNAYNRFDVRELELDIRAAVHPRADAVAVIAFARDAENPIFPDEDEEAEGPETSVDLEEAYLFLHDFGVPNLTAKVGRFHVRFGRQNVLHLHDLPTSDPPFVNQAFLAPESLKDAGLSLSYVVPNPWNQYVEAVVEILTGEGGGSESPTLQGDLSVDSPAVNTHLPWNTDLGSNWNLELGGSWLWGHADEHNSRDVHLFGGDLTLLRTDPKGGFNNQVFQAELIRSFIDLEDGSKENAWGAYVLAQQQLTRDWYIGARFDWTQSPFESNEEIWGITPYLSWYWSDFLRFRLAYQHKDGDVPDEDVVYFQITWVFGAHPTHPYWSMR